MDRNEQRKQAMERVGSAYQHHMRGELDRALELYTEAIRICPTPEAYTFRGWARSFRGEYEAAIQDCHRAIDLDPEFGNPYNDIGAYYLELGQPEEAVPWLRMALKARRYENACFPHFNLGKAFEALGRPGPALEHYRGALEQNPAYPAARRALERLLAERSRDPSDPPLPDTEETP